MFQRLLCAARHFPLEIRQGIQLLPEADWIAKLAFCNLAQPTMLFTQDKGAASVLHAVAVPGENGFASFMMLQRQVASFGCKVRADSEPNQIVGVRERIAFVEIVDAPDKPAFGITPGPEILDMQIADCQDTRGLHEVGANFRPELSPTVVRGSKKKEKFSLHTEMFQTQVFPYDVGAMSQPVFIAARGFDYVHTAEDSWAKGTSQPELGIRKQTPDIPARSAEIEWTKVDGNRRVSES